MWVTVNCVNRDVVIKKCHGSYDTNSFITVVLSVLLATLTHTFPAFHSLCSALLIFSGLS